jgi:hypothetical protein
MVIGKVVTWQEVNTKLDSIATRLANVKPLVEEIERYKSFTGVHSFAARCYLLMDSNDADERLAGAMALDKAAKQILPVHPTIPYWYNKEKDEVVRAKIVDLSTNITFEHWQVNFPKEVETNKVFIANSLSDPSWLVVESALLGIGELKANDLYPVMQSFLYTEGNPQLRKVAAYAISSMREGESFGELVKAFHEECDENVAASIIDVMGTLAASNGEDVELKGRITDFLLDRIKEEKKKEDSDAKKGESKIRAAAIRSLTGISRLLF